jgi:hypothetical protein
VTRTAPSPADQELIAACAEWDAKPTATQLERWRHYRQLPRNERRALGRQRGSTSTYPPEAAPIAAALWHLSRQGVNRHEASVRLFSFGALLDETAVRAAALWAVGRRQRDMRKIQDGGEERVDQFVQRIRASVRPWDPSLPHYEKPASAPRAVLDVRRKARRQRQDAVELGAQLAMDPDLVCADNILRMLRLAGAASFAEELGPVLRAAEAAGRPMSPWVDMHTTLVGIAEHAPITRLAAARSVLVGWSPLQWSLPMLAVVDANVRAVWLEMQEADPGRMWLTFPAVTDRPEVVMVTVLMIAASDNLVHQGWDLVRRLTPVMLAASADSLPGLPPDVAATFGGVAARLDLPGDIPTELAAGGVEALAMVARTAADGLL